MSRYKLFSGVATALITPFCPDGSLDAEAFSHLVRRQVGTGVAALVTGGTTGEAPTLTDDEKNELIRIAVSEGGGLPVIAGAGSPDTSHAVKMAREAESAGASALLTVTPYYNKTSPDGLVGYYRAVCGATSLPVIAYVVPSRTGMGLPEEVWGELFAIPNLIGVKDAAGNLSSAARLISRLGDEVCVWSGSDELTLPYLSLGGDGVISVASNLVPERMAELCRAFFAGETKKAADISARLQPLFDVLFSEVNPIPVKAAAEMAGLCSGVCRPPLVRPRAAVQRQLYRVLSGFPELDLKFPV